MPSFGSVITRVYTSSAYLPLAGIPVIFTQLLPDGSRDLLAVRMTDSSGLTTPLLIETPDISESLTPGALEQPFSTLEISAAAPGFDQITIERVQVFPGIETIQGIQLRPTATGEENASILFPGSSQNL